MQGISIRPTIGVGDSIQFSSVPENYFRATGKRIVDVSKPWFFDHNPYVTRLESLKPTNTTEMWNYVGPPYPWPKPRELGVYTSNAEIHAGVLGVPVSLIRPRLYQFEDFPFEKRENILLHIDGKSHGCMPDHVVQHVLQKYGKTGRLFQIGKPSIDLGLPKIETPTLWDLARVISEARMLIGMHSGPSWVAACYPDVIVKKLRTKPSLDVLKDWVPLERRNIHSFWDDRCHQIFNVSEHDVGFTSSYRNI